MLNSSFMKSSEKHSIMSKMFLFLLVSDYTWQFTSCGLIPGTRYRLFVYVIGQDIQRNCIEVTMSEGTRIVDMKCYKHFLSSYMIGIS